MESGFFNSNDGGDPAWFQHLAWYLGHPEAWLTLILWIVLFVAIVKIAKRLWRLQKTGWLVLFVLTVGASLAYYAWISVHAYSLYQEGLGTELIMLPQTKRLFLVLSVLSAGWLAFDWLKARRLRKAN